jgi:uncharacterized protein YodC (DUF2158 family)
MSIIPGSLVKLKSGGPDMTVVSVVGNNVKVKWFEGGLLREEVFNKQVFLNESQNTKQILFG